LSLLATITQWKFVDSVDFATFVVAAIHEKFSQISFVCLSGLPDVFFKPKIPIWEHFSGP
jgi:hypothetical protein